MFQTAQNYNNYLRVLNFKNFGQKNAGLACFSSPNHRSIFLQFHSIVQCFNTRYLMHLRRKQKKWKKCSKVWYSWICKYKTIVLCVLCRAYDQRLKLYGCSSGWFCCVKRRVELLHRLRTVWLWQSAKDTSQQRLIRSSKFITNSTSTTYCRF